MRTRRSQSKVSAVAAGALLPAVLSVGGCAGRQYPLTAARGAERIGIVASAEARSDMLQVDNQATMYVDVYLIADQIEWRLGRIPAGMRASLRVPQSAIDWTSGFVQVAVIAGAQISAEAWRDPGAVIGIAQPVSSLLAQSWTFRQPTGAGLQLLAVPIR